MHCLPSRHQVHIVVEADFTSELVALHLLGILPLRANRYVTSALQARKRIAMLYVSESSIGIAKSKKCAQIDM